MLKIAIAAAVLCVMVGAYAADEPGRLYAGTAKADITPPEKDAMDLSNHKLTIQDHIYARVLVLKTDQTSLAIVSLDLILFGSEKVVADAKEKWGVDHVILSSSHTHSGMAPKGLIIGGGGPRWTRHHGDPRELVDWPALSEDPWYAATEEKIVAAIGEAMANLFPARIAVGKSPFKSDYMAHNRRRVNKNGTVTMMWRNPGKVPTEPLDPQIRVIRVDDEAGRPRAVAVHYACHAVIQMHTGVLSRDFPGATVDYIEEQMGEGCMGMFLQGAEGDIDSYSVGVGGDRGREIARNAGISLGKAAVHLAKDTIPAQRAENSLKAAQNLVRIAYRGRRGFTEACITTVLINKDLALVTIPGEPFIQHQLNLSSESAVPNTLMLGVAYSGRGCPFLVYIPTAQAVKEGGYGATECSFVEPLAGKRMVTMALTRINDFMKEEP